MQSRLWSVRDSFVAAVIGFFFIFIFNMFFSPFPTPFHTCFLSSHTNCTFLTMLVLLHVGSAALASWSSVC